MVKTEEYKEAELEDILYKKSFSFKSFNALISRTINEYPLQSLCLSFTLGLILGVTLTDRD